MIPMRQRRGRQTPAAPLSVPAPTGGLNALDSLAAMPPMDAVILDNFFPQTTTVDLRNGCKTIVTGLPANVESLMTYNGASVSKMFAASGTAFYDVSVAGAVGAAVVSGLANARWQHVNFGTPGNQFLMAVNGADKLAGYDGSAWWRDGGGTHDITGVDTATCVHINSYKNRVYLVKKDSFSVYYLPLNSIAGAATQLDLAPLFRLGGYLMAMATWTIDNTQGVNEYAVFISSQGEVALYYGSDPGSTDWQLRGMFRVGRPIGRRCFVKYGADLALICADGLMPLSKALLTDRTQDQNAISYKITNLITGDVTTFGANFGWQVLLYPIGNKLILNVPTIEGKTQVQYVMNTITGAWCRFTGWNANCFELFNDDLYFGSNLGATANSAYVAKCDTGFSDDGAYIVGEVKTAFRYFGAPGQQKQITMVRPIFRTAGRMGAAIAMDMDFSDNYPQSMPTFSGTTQTAWGTALWNTFPWGSTAGILKDWQGVNAIGDAGSLHMRIVNNQFAVEWQSVEYLYKVGGFV